MKIRMLFAMSILVIFYNCKSGNRAENTEDTAVTEEKSDSAVMEEITGGFVGIKDHSVKQKDTVTLYGDPDYDFAVVMHIHNRHGIAMADEEIKYGADTAMRSFAGKIKENQEEELKELEAFISNNKPKGNNQEFLQEMKSNIQKAKEETNQSTGMSGNFDRDFTTLMALHHKQGQDLAKTEVKFGENQEMKNLARNMIRVRNQEIDRLKDYK